MDACAAFISESPRAPKPPTATPFEDEYKTLGDQGFDDAGLANAEFSYTASELSGEKTLSSNRGGEFGGSLGARVLFHKSKTAG